ncbi:MarR family winged helix-turn-helix transcriptional regulator [Nocardioides sp. Iso805N]|uniref:MarR family winged helix-turn-helix transcriptional regulator n=1 Tax=Nocardioides sp. Iso805N TaxID=1283287 RepID=UPI000369901E|nr:MarR family winged helix-turn-helix transcriptional regulator [Nocardioides sp. Iso805N]
MDRPDLGTMTARLLREIVRLETPILAASGLEMWDYVVLAALLGGDAATQRELAAATGRDQTRLIRNLDGLEERGLITRSPDPADRRNKVVALTGSGRDLVGACRARIRVMETELLLSLPADERAALERALVRLVGNP